MGELSPDSRFPGPFQKTNERFIFASLPGMRQAGETSAALIIPALNEEAVIAQMLATIPAALFDTIIVADNGSTDGTAEIARASGACVATEPERGYGAASLRALREIPEHIQAVVFTQADCSEDAREAQLLLTPSEEGRADRELGSRTLGRAAGGWLLAHQRWGNRLFVLLIRMFFQHRFTDLGPFRAIRLGALRKLNMQDRNFGWTVEMQILALRQRLRILEVPVSYHLRIAGDNKVSGNLWTSFQAGWKMIAVLIRLALRGS